MRCKMVTAAILLTLVALTVAVDEPVKLTLEELPCEPPPFLDKLDDALATKIRAAWEGYSSGKCVELHKKTQDFLDQVSDEDLAAAIEKFVLAAAAHGGTPCHPPPFHPEFMPDEAQSKIDAIWEGYRSGNDCTKRIHATKKVINTLPTDIQDKLWRPHKEGGEDRLRKRQIGSVLGAVGQLLDPTPSAYDTRQVANSYDRRNNYNYNQQQQYPPNYNRYQLQNQQYNPGYNQGYNPGYNQGSYSYYNYNNPNTYRG